MKDIVARNILFYRSHATHKDRRLRGIMQPVSRHSPIKIKVNGRVWYDVICVALNCFRERRLHMRDNKEGIDATRLATTLANNNAPNPVRDANFEGSPILHLCYAMGHS